MLKQSKKFVRDLLKNIFGEDLFINYHTFLAKMASKIYGNPSRKMLVVAVTGTKGKTSTLNFLWHVLTAGGYKVGMISTANIKIGTVEKMNWYHMTMPGRFLLQKLLNEMHKARCDIVLVEATSEGIKMGRLVGLYYDVAIFTNLFPEHLKSHNNSFEEYRNTKGRLFDGLMKLPTKRWNGGDVEKTSIINLDDENGHYFSQFDADKKYSYGATHGDHKFTDVKESKIGVTFSLDEVKYFIPLLGVFNVYNAVPAILLARHLNIDKEKIQEGIRSCVLIPGRMEIIDEGQNFTAIVDYAHEGVSMRQALEAAQVAKKTSQNKIIAVYGAEGGGRDTTKRETMSKAVTELADYAIVTLSDPFDSDPGEINKDILKWLEKFGFRAEDRPPLKKNIWDFVDRREAIKKAVSLAEDGDVILFASKGAEQSIIFKDKSIPWDDRVEVRLAIQNNLHLNLHEKN